MNNIEKGLTPTSLIKQTKDLVEYLSFENESRSQIDHKSLMLILKTILFGSTNVVCIYDLTP